MATSVSDRCFGGVMLSEASPRTRLDTAAIQLWPHQQAMVRRAQEVEARVTEERAAEDRLAAEDKRVMEEWRAQVRQALATRQPPPPPLATLRPRQKPTNFGIMADKAGAGKTFAILGLVLADKLARAAQTAAADPSSSSSSSFSPPQRYDPRDPRQARKMRPYAAGGNDPQSDTAAKKRRGGSGCTLIVVPTNIFVQWKSSIQRFGGGLLSDMNFDNFQSISRLGMGADARELLRQDVLVTTSIHYELVVSMMAGHRIRRVIFDEIDTIVTEQADVLQKHQSVVTDFTWLVSASFDRMLMKLTGGSICEGIGLSDRVLMQRLVLCDERFVDASLGLTDYDYRRVVCLNVILDRVMAGVVSHETLSALNCMEYKHVRSVRDNKPARGLHEALRLVLDKLRHDIETTEEVNRWLVKRSHFDCDKVADLKEDLAALLEEKLRFLQLSEGREDRATKLAEFRLDAKEKELRDELLRISQVEDEKKVHQGSMSRLDGELRALQDNLAALGASEEHPPPEPDPEETKLARACQIAREALARGGRVTIFVSKWDDVLQKVGASMPDVRMAELDGGTPEKMHAILERFRDGTNPVLLVNSILFAAGMDLQETTDLVLMHSLQESVLKQVVGRAQRPGRHGRLTVWHLLHENEVTTVAPEVPKIQHPPRMEEEALRTQLEDEAMAAEPQPFDQQHLPQRRAVAVGMVGGTGAAGGGGRSTSRAARPPPSGVRPGADPRNCAQHQQVARRAERA
jgi:SNF2-related domain/Helicase conserved C-terminal domain